MTSSPAWTVTKAVATDAPDVRAFLLNIFERDYGYGYRAEWHTDLDNFSDVYVHHPRHMMLIARRPDRPVVGTAGLRIGFPKPAAHPVAIQRRYLDLSRVAEIIRVATDPTARRSGLASTLVHELLRLAAHDTDSISLHTNALVPSAVPFWRSVGMTEIYDSGTQNHDGALLHTVYFESNLRSG